jgi:hypothetical protein
MPLFVAAFPCCRDHDLFWPMGNHAQAIQREPGDEAYWLSWTSECRAMAARPPASSACLAARQA